MISTETLKEYLQVDGTAKDSFLGVCIANTVSEIESYCNRKFEAGEFTEYLDGDSGRSFFLTNYPVTAINSIAYFDGSDWKALTDSTNDYYIVPEVNKVHLVGSVLPYGTNNIKVSYQAGWNVNECPADLKGAITEMASVFYFNSPKSGQARLGLSSKNIGSQVSESSGYKDLDWQSKVRKYKKMLVR